MPDVRRLPLQWSLFADRMLRQRARTMDAAALASSLGRTPMDVRARALAIGVEIMGEADAMDRAWSAGELRYLRQQYRRMTPAEIGRQLGRSAGAVRRRIESMGLRKNPARPEPPQASLPMEQEAVQLPEADLPGPVDGLATKWAEPRPEPGSGDSAVPEGAASKRAETAPEPKAKPAPFRWWTADEDERLRQLVKDKVPLPELAELFGRSEAEVARRIARVCEEPDPAVQAGNQRWGFKAKPKPKAKAKASGPISEDRLESMSKMDLLSELAGLA